MRWLVLVWSAAWLGLAGCSGGYPLPPTRCDEWCDATKGRTCPEYYRPANCVAECEQANVDREECTQQFDAVISCYRGSKLVLAQACSWDNLADDCVTELRLLDTCVQLGYLPML